jgi:hypothetical protein
VRHWRRTAIRIGDCSDEIAIANISDDDAVYRDNTPVAAAQDEGKVRAGGHCGSHLTRCRVAHHSAAELGKSDLRRRVLSIQARGKGVSKGVGDDLRAKLAHKLEVQRFVERLADHARQQLRVLRCSNGGARRREDLFLSYVQGDRVAFHETPLVANARAYQSHRSAAARTWKIVRAVDERFARYRSRSWRSCCGFVRRRQLLGFE